MCRRILVDATRRQSRLKPAGGHPFGKGGKECGLRARAPGNACVLASFGGRSAFACTGQRNSPRPRHELWPYCLLLAPFPVSKYMIMWRDPGIK